MNGSTEGTFAAYLARQYIAKKKYAVATAPEALALGDAGDIVLTRSDGFNFQILCIVDRQAHPERTFSRSPADVLAIGETCLRYAGKLNNRQMPVSIQVVEVGTAFSQDDRLRLATYRRRSIFGKVIVSGWAIDVAAGTVWSNAPLGGALAGRGFVSKLLREPRLSDAELARTEAPKALAPPRFPSVTYALLALLVGVFAIEIAWAVGPVKGLLAPSLDTLVALGGLNRPLVAQGEWYRIVTCVVLHADATHLLMNGIALVMVGHVLERLVGRVWFAALFVIGGLAGSFMSLAINPPNLVSVGASGAIMGLFAAAAVASFRLPFGAARTQVQVALWRVLIPSLIPLASSRNGPHVDIGAHLGGALAGAAAGIVLLRSWADDAVAPRFRAAAAAIALAGAALLAGSGEWARYRYPAYAVVAHLIPAEQLPKNDAEAAEKADALVVRYPDDPRGHYLRASRFIQQAQWSSAEAELRASLHDGETLRRYFKPAFEAHLKAWLAIVLSAQGRTDEARLTAAPVCAVAPAEKRLLATRHLCE